MPESRLVDSLHLSPEDHITYFNPQQMLDFCLELSKIEVLKMLDLQTKSSITSNKLQVQH
jgi:hypothetical protein